MSVEASLQDGMRRLVELKEPKRRFKQSVELLINIKDLDISKPENRFTEIIELPHGLGEKRRKVAVIASGNLALQASRSDNVDKVFQKEEIEAIVGNKRAAKKLARQYDYFLVEPSLIATTARALGAALGAKGKSPVPIPPNSDIDGLAAKYSRSVTVRVRKSPQAACIIGTEDMDEKTLLENAEAVISRVVERLERKWGNIKSIYLKKSMGPPVEVELVKAKKK